MIDARKLFRRRLISEWRFQYRVWKMAVDWTVALYIVIPALLVAGYQYVSWWRDMPGWGQAVPETAWLIVLYISCGFGSVRLFLEEADQLFLIRNAEWMKRLKGSGVGYSLTVRVFLSMLAVGLVAPFLVQVHGYGTSRLLLLAALAVATGTHTLLAGRIITLRLSRFLGWIANTAAFIVLGAAFVTAGGSGAAWLWTAALTLLLAVSTVFLVKLRLGMSHAFYQDAAYESDQRMKFVALLLGHIVPKPSKILKRTKPLVLRNSRTLFGKRTPDRVLAETIVKSFFRSGTQVRLYVQFTLACSFGLLLMPVTVKWLFWLAVSLPLAYWVKMYGKEVQASSFVKLFPWRDEDRVKAIRRATPLLFVPAYALTGLALGWTAYGLWAGLVLIPAGWVIGYVMGELFNAW
jgi:ABC-2 type transport system permease protein